MLELGSSLDGFQRRIFMVFSIWPSLKFLKLLIAFRENLEVLLQKILFEADFDLGSTFFYRKCANRGLILPLLIRVKPNIGFK
jgi:hypothetical protein